MPDYLHTNGYTYSEQEVLNAAKKKNQTLQQYLNSMPELSLAGEEPKTDDVSLGLPEIDATQEILTPVDTSHPTVEDFKTAVKGPKGYLQREGQIKNLLEEHYGNTDISHLLTFNDVKGGKDAIEVLVGDQKPGEGAVFDFYGGISGDARLSWGMPGKHEGGVRKHTDDDQMFESLVNHIKYELNPEKKKKDFQEVINTLGPENTRMLNFLDDENSAGEFVHTLDKIINPDKETPSFTGVDTEWISRVVNDPNATIGEKLNARTAGIVSAFHDNIDYKTGGRVWKDWMAKAPVIGQIGNLFLEGKQVDMSGGMMIDDGKGGQEFLSYEYIWNNREQIYQQHQQNVKEDDENERVSDLGEGVIKVNKHKDGTQSYDFKGVYKDTKDNGDVIALRKTSEQNLLWMGDMLNSLKKDLDDPSYGGEGRPVLEEKLKDLEDKYKQMSKDLGITPLYDEDGFIDIEKTTEEGEGFTKEEEQLEVNADMLAKNHDIEFLAQKLEGFYYDLLSAGKNAHANRAEVYKGLGAIESLGDLFDPNNDSFDNDMSQLAEISDSNNLFIGTRWTGEDKDKPITGGLLTELAGGSRDALDYNEALKKFRTYYRALHLNMDLSQNPQEAFIGKVFDDLGKSVYGGTAGFGGQGEISEDDMVDAFESTLEQDNFVIPDRGEGKKWSDMNRRGKGFTLRNISEGAAGVITDLTPLLIELAAFKKAGGLKKLQTSIGKIANRFTKGAKNKFYKNVVRNVVTPGVVTAVEWGAAETLGQTLMGGKHSDMWRAQTINLQTGETRLMFPFVMGATGGMLKMAGDWMTKAMYASQYGGILKGLSKVDPASAKWKRIANVGIQPIKAVSRAGLHGATATGFLTVSEFAQEEINSLVKNGRLATAEELSHLTDTEHLLNTWVAMTVLGGRTMVPKVKNSIMESIAGLNKNTVASKSAAKELNRKGTQEKDGRYDKLETTRIEERSR